MSDELDDVVKTDEFRDVLLKNGIVICTTSDGDIILGLTLEKIAELSDGAKKSDSDVIILKMAYDSMIKSDELLN